MYRWGDGKASLVKGRWPEGAGGFSPSEGATEYKAWPGGIAPPRKVGTSGGQGRLFSAAGVGVLDDPRRGQDPSLRCNFSRGFVGSGLDRSVPCGGSGTPPPTGVLLSLRANLSHTDPLPFAARPGRSRRRHRRRRLCKSPRPSRFSGRRDCPQRRAFPPARRAGPRRASCKSLTYRSAAIFSPAWSVSPSAS